GQGKGRPDRRRQGARGTLQDDPRRSSLHCRQGSGEGQRAREEGDREGPGEARREEASHEGDREEVARPIGAPRNNAGGARSRRRSCSRMLESVELDRVDDCPEFPVELDPFAVDLDDPDTDRIAGRARISSVPPDGRVVPEEELIAWAWVARR